MNAPVESFCPTCLRPVESPSHRRERRQLVKQIYALEREILSLQEGALESTIEQQTAAPACSICAQAAPGKPGQPTPVADLIRPLRRQLDALEQDLNRLDREGTS